MNKLIVPMAVCVVAIVVILGVVFLQDGTGTPMATPSPPASEPAEEESEAPSSTALPSPRTNIYMQDGAIVVGGDGEPIELVNNPDATNPTYAELLAFMKKDRTDEYSYIFGPPKVAYVCSDFAEDVHNNAEAAGIKTAWVGIDIDGKTEGHACNAFETTDIGLVYIDCTGKELWSESPNRSSWDRRARVEIGKAYAVADINNAKTRFKSVISCPNADRQYILGDALFSPIVTDEQVIRSLKALGWMGLDTSEKRMQKSHEVLEWSRTHNIEELGLKWMQEWVREHEVELYGWDFDPHKFADGTVAWHSEWYVQYVGWCILVDCLDTSWFQPVEKLIDVDGIPLVWKIRWDTEVNWWRPLGVVEDIHIYW